MLDESKVKSKKVTLGPKESEKVEHTFTVTEDMVGTHNVEVDGQSVTLTVKGTKKDESAPTSTPPDGAPGFEIPVSIAGLVSVSYLVLKRKIK